MKNRLAIRTLFMLLFLFVAIGCKNNGQEIFHSVQNEAAEIDSLLEMKSYFEARRRFDKTRQKLRPMDSLYLAAQLLHYFNKLESSKKLAARLKAYGRSKLSDSLLFKVASLQYVNHAKLHQYALAYDLGKRLLRDYPRLLSEKEEADYRNANEIWQKLRNTPPQKLTRTATTEIQMVRDKANLRNLPVTVGEKTTPFIFDTGANISTIIQSKAETLEMKRIPASIQVGSITGIQVEASLAVCPSLQIGNMVFEHVVFLVFPDEALYIPQLDYQIQGILGFPVIEAMKEITLTGDDQLLVPLRPKSRSGVHMALNFLTPIIELQLENGQCAPYSFDTGAVTTMLYPSYFEEYREDIEKNHSLGEIKFGGAGGSVVKAGYHIPFTPKISGKTVVLDSVELIAQDTTNTFANYYGNIGQDLIQKFDTMTLNFESMYIAFE